MKLEASFGLFVVLTLSSYPAETVASIRTGVRQNTPALDGASIRGPLPAEPVTPVAGELVPLAELSVSADELEPVAEPVAAETASCAHSVDGNSIRQRIAVSNRMAFSGMKIRTSILLRAWRTPAKYCYVFVEA